MYHRLLLNFVRRFSYLQQYLIVFIFSLILLIIFNRWWCIFLLPTSTILANYTIKRLSRSNQSPLKISGKIYNCLLRKRSIKQDDLITQKVLPSSEAPLETESNEIIIEKEPEVTPLEKECKKYFQTIIARYICVWYYPIVSTDQAFPKDLENIFKIITQSLIQRLKLLNTYDLIRHIINLKQKHIEQYLYTVDSYKKQRKQNRISQSIVEEFSQLIGFHSSIVKNDTHAYLRAIVELLITSLIPENLYIYSDSRPGREFLTQMLINIIFLPLLNEFSKPRMIYTLLIILLESEEQKKTYETSENSRVEQSEIVDHQNEQQPNILTKHFTNQVRPNYERRESYLEKIIYTANIISCDRAYNSMSGAAYTVYIIECETKSPYTSDAVHRYTIRRRFREFMNLHKRLQQNHLTSQHCYGLNIDEVFRVLPIPIDNMSPDIINQRKSILDKYIKQIISNDVLNCSHDVLEFFAFNSDPNIQFESSPPPTKLPLPRVDKVLLRTLSGVGTKLNTLLPSKREITPFRETFQLNISTSYEETSSPMEQLKSYVNYSVEKSSKHSLTLKPTDSEFLQSLITRPSIVSGRRKEKTQSNIPLTDAILNLIHTCLHSRDAMISNESIHQILRTFFGHFIEELLKNQIDNILSEEKIITYLVELRTKVLWPDENNTSPPMKNVKHRAYNAFLNRIPISFQQIVGVDNIHRIIANLLQCLSYEELNRHFICNTLDLVIEKLIPNLTNEEFLKKYVQMHSNIRT